MTYIPQEHSLGGAVYLRPLEEDDVTETYLAWFKDEEVTRFLDARDITKQDAIEHLHAGKKGNAWYLFAICESTTDQHIGNLKVGPIHYRHATSDLVTVLGDRSSWGKGYGKEAVRIGIDIAFNHLNVRKLSASIDSLNVASIKTYCGAGFVVEATLKDQYMDLSSGDMVLSDKVFIACYNRAFIPDVPR